MIRVWREIHIQLMNISWIYTKSIKRRGDKRVRMNQAYKQVYNIPIDRLK